MGFYWQGLPPYLIPWAKALLPGPVAAIETGTFEGETSALLARSFGSCVTIERSSTLASAARAKFAKDPRVLVIEGSSQDALPLALDRATGARFLWLDAHGFYDYDGADSVENPLLAELDLVFAAANGDPCVIAIDDARGMGIQPGWPSLASVFAVLDANGYQAAIVDDVVVAAPRTLHPDFYALYGASRIVEVSALFHVWPRVAQMVKLRSWSDSAFVKVKHRLGR